MKFSIVTPSYNRLKYFDKTIRSVISQEGDFEIEYIIQDGGSSSNIIDFFKDWENKIYIDNNNLIKRCNKIEFSWYSEPDKGMYDAIVKGFSKSTGEIMAWINTDDFYLPGAFSTVSQVFQKFPDINWICGIPTRCNQYSSIIDFGDRGKPYLQDYIKLGYYNSKYKYYGFSWIQQDAVFWKRNLWENIFINNKLDLSSFKYAGDFHLWREFSTYTDLAKIHAELSSFRIHENQITSTLDLYFGELPCIYQNPQKSLLLYNVLQQIICLSPKFKNFLETRYKKSFNILLGVLGLQLRQVTGRCIKWSQKDQTWILKNEI